MLSVVSFASAFAALTEAVAVCDPEPSDEGHKQVNESDGQRLAAVETGLVLFTEQVTGLAQSVGMKCKVPSAPAGLSPLCQSYPQRKRRRCSGGTTGV
jgi:hypothetical protein